MKYFLFLTSFFIINGCSCQKKINSKTDFIENFKVESFICPEGGTCDLQVVNNKSILLKTVNDKIYYDIKDDSTKITIVYTYSKNIEASEYDGGIQEKIIFEIESKNYQISLQDSSLSQVKLIYKKVNNARAPNTYLPISKGKLVINTLNGKINFNLEFEISNNSQITKVLNVIDGKL